MYLIDGSDDFGIVSVYCMVDSQPAMAVGDDRLEVARLGPSAVLVATGGVAEFGIAQPAKPGGADRERESHTLHPYLAFLLLPLHLTVDASNHAITSISHQPPRGRSRSRLCTGFFPCPSCTRPDLHQHRLL